MKELKGAKLQDRRNKEKSLLKVLDKIEILKQLLIDIENINYNNCDDDYYWHGINEAERKITELIENKIESLKGE